VSSSVHFYGKNKSVQQQHVQQQHVQQQHVQQQHVQQQHVQQQHVQQPSTVLCKPEAASAVLGSP